MRKADLVRVGKVLRSEGREGRLKVKLLEKGFPEPAPERVVLGGPGGFEAYDVESLTLDRNSHVLKLKSVDTLARADALAGREIYLPETAFRPLEAGRYYDFQLLGCRVATAGGTEVGTVRGLLAAGGQDLLVVARGESEVYVPFVEAICRRVDTAGREIVIDPPDGLLDLNEI